MEFFIFFMLFSSIFLNTEAVKCDPSSPDVLFPFSLQTPQSPNCSYNGFKLFCRENKTVIEFPSFGDLVVKSISYDTKRLDLLDPRNCVHGVFLNLNLSSTPFQYYFVVKNYTYLNCSAPLSPSSTWVPCLSGPGHRVYVVEPLAAAPGFCRVVKTVAIPFAYSPYLDDDSFGLGFTWDLPTEKDFEVKGGDKESWPECLNMADGRAISFLIFIFIAATLVGVKACCSKIDWVGKFFRQVDALNKLPKQKRGQGYGDYASEECKGMLPDEACVYMPETIDINKKAPQK
ncbi:hypothetical protein NMG60_11027376 [Bertholletia excelsa]